MHAVVAVFSELDARGLNARAVLHFDREVRRKVYAAARLADDLQVLAYHGRVVVAGFDPHDLVEQALEHTGRRPCRQRGECAGGRDRRARHARRRAIGRSASCKR